MKRNLQSSQRLYMINLISIWRTHTRQSKILRSDKFRGNSEVGGRELVWSSLDRNWRMVQRLKDVSNRQQCLVHLRFVLPVKKAEFFWAASMDLDRNTRRGRSRDGTQNGHYGNPRYPIYSSPAKITTFPVTHPSTSASAHQTCGKPTISPCSLVPAKRVAIFLRL